MTNGNGNGTHAERPVQLAPYSVEAEEALLGSILLDPELLHTVSLFLGPQDFFYLRHGWIFDVMTSIAARKEQIDYLTVVDELRTRGQLDEVGGAAYVTQVINRTPSSLYGDTYARIIERAAIRRRGVDAATQIARLMHDETADINQVIDQSEAALLTALRRKDAGAVKSMSNIAGRVFSKVEKARQTGVSGIATGFVEYDKRTGGLQDTDLIIVAGRPGMGKTSWLLSVVFHVCLSGGLRPLIVSKEMSDEQLLARMVAMECGVTTQQQRTGKMTDAEFAAFTNAIDKLSGFSALVEDGSSMSIRQLAALARREKREHHIDLLIVDYLQLLSGDGDNRTQEVGSISRGLKAIARELKIPVLAAAQLSRKCEERQDKRPILSDLRDSGEIEQDADIVIFLYREEMYDENTTRPNQADMIVAKHRNGPTFSEALYFRKELTQFTNLTKVDVDLAGYSRDFDKATIPALPHAARVAPDAGERSER